MARARAHAECGSRQGFASSRETQKDPQLGTLGAGNHSEVQIVDEVHDEWAARHMGIGQKGQVVVMIHSGSRIRSPGRDLCVARHGAGRKGQA